MQMRNCLLPASGFRVNVDNRYPVEEEGRVSPHEEQGQLLEEVANCFVLILARLSGQSSAQLLDLLNCNTMPPTYRVSGKRDETDALLPARFPRFGHLSLEILT